MTGLQTDRTPELEAERAVLGGILIDPVRLDDAVDLLGEADFFRDAHKRIWAAMRQIVTRGGAIDLVTVRAELGAHLEDAGGPVYLAGLVDGVSRSSNVAHYAGLVRDYALRRAVEALAHRLLGAAQAGDLTGGELLEQGEAGLLGLRTAQPGTAVSSPADGASEAIAAIEDAAAGKRRGVPSGLDEIDGYTHGWQPGQLIVLGARPAQGKTALALNLTVAAGRVAPVLFCSLEMSALQIRLRELALRSGLPHRLIEAGHVRGGAQQAMTTALEAVHAGGVHILDRPGATVAQIRAAARRLMAQTRGPLALVVVDYLQLMRSERGSRPENRTQEVAQFSAGLKMLARELAVPVVALSQLSRQAETRADKRPFLADLRESGSLEQDADTVLLLHRPGVYDPAAGETAAEVIIAKQRNGPTGLARLHFDAAVMRFTDAPFSGGNDGQQ
jgi:replicative DNA helicase